VQSAICDHCAGRNISLITDTASWNKTKEIIFFLVAYEIRSAIENKILQTTNSWSEIHLQVTESKGEISNNFVERIVY